MRGVTVFDKGTFGDLVCCSETPIFQNRKQKYYCSKSGTSDAVWHLQSKSNELILGFCHVTWNKIQCCDILEFCSPEIPIHS